MQIRTSGPNGQVQATRGPPKKLPGELFTVGFHSGHEGDAAVDPATRDNNQIAVTRLLGQWKQCATAYQHSLQQRLDEMHQVLDRLFGQAGSWQALQQRCEQLEHLVQQAQDELVQQSSRVVELQEQWEAVTECLREAGFQDESPLAALWKLVHRYQELQQQHQRQQATSDSDHSLIQGLQRELKALRRQNERLLEQLQEAEEAIQAQRRQSEEERQGWMHELQALRQLIQEQAVQAFLGGQTADPGQPAAPADLRSAAEPQPQVAQNVAAKLKKIKKKSRKKSDGNP